MTAPMSRRTLQFDAGAFVGQAVDVSLRLDVAADSPRPPRVRASIDFPVTFDETRRVIAPRVLETRYSVVATQIGLFGYGVTAVDADGQRSDSEVYWFHIPEIVDVEIADMRLQVEGTRVTLRWLTHASEPARFTAWSRRLGPREALASLREEWQSRAYDRVAETQVQRSGAAGLEWQQPVGRYAILLLAEDHDGPRMWGPWVATVGSPTRLHAATPNPFNPRTRLRFSLARHGAVGIEIVQVDGTRVRRLLQQEMDAGEHHVDWDGLDDRGRAVASGVYIARLRSRATLVDTQRLVLLR